MATQFDIYIFAHQDDEIGVFPQILSTLKSERQPVCMYLTMGSENDPEQTKRRNVESTKVLSSLGVSNQHIYFVGENTDVPDGQLHMHMIRVQAELEKIFKTY